MATVPTRPTPETPLTETVEQRFRRLKTVWEADTLYLSSTTDICQHPAFREIVAMGETVVPFMLREMEQEPQFWVWALPEISGANPVAPEDRGRIDRMSEAWVRWGKLNGYRW